uniref:Ig-like domain-containing protein n=1 Tax=Naja naja TaxID=35670 RepID=A0A8C6VNE8_NAJNA
MVWSIFLFAFLNYYSGVNSQTPWTQPTSMSVSRGQTVKLPCTVTGTVNTISWYQQSSGQAPRYVHYSGGNRGDGIPDRFMASVSGSTGYLTITGTLAEDEADYYCLMWHSSASSLHGATI